MSIERTKIYELLGTPEAGKTTVFKELQKRNFDSSEIVFVNESAEELPTEIPKGSWEANLWISNQCTKKLLEAYYKRPQKIVVDRGMCDRVFHAYLYFQTGNCTYEQYVSSLNFVKSFEVIGSTKLFVFYVSPEEAIRRRGGEGRIVTYDYIKNFNALTEDFFNKNYYNLPKKFINTTNLSIDEELNEVVF